ncbi:acyltransferase-domain-containing protein [Thermothelomyces heterothallicus CBS 202.75]
MAPDDRHDSAPDLRILGDRITLQPSGYVEPALPEDGKEEALMKNMARFRSEPLRFLREVSLYVSGTGWRAYDHVLGQPIFYSGFSEHIKSQIMSATLLQTKIAQLADMRVAVEEKQGLLNPDDRDFVVKKAQRRAVLIQALQEVAENLTDKMICKFDSKPFIRGAYYLVTQLLLRAYHQGIHVSSEEVLRLRRVAEEAARKKQSIIFLPCHRSHVDYVSMQLLCYRLGLALPVVVAGDNLNFPIVGSFLQHAGAMYIRRSFGDDQLYSTLVQTYIDVLLQGGYNLECFIEGGRSRTGKLLPPKFGILNFVLDSLLSGRVEDAIICPVSTQYDKVIETEGYVTELLGVPKKKENLADFLTGGSSVLSLRLGRVDVRFHEPWSLRGFINEQLLRIFKMPPPIDIDWRDTKNQARRQKLLRTLGYKVLADINAVSVVMPTALIGTVLLTLRGRGVGRTELIRRVEWLTDRIRAKGGRVAHFGNAPLPDVIERGLDVLGKDLVGVVEGLAEPTYYAVDRFQLSFYRNMTIHLFISEALVAAALYTRVKRGGGPPIQDIPYQDLHDQVLFLSSLFRGEFIYSGEGLATNLERTLLGLEADNVIHIERDEEGNITKVGLSDAERAAGRENYDFYCFLIWPFIEASWLAAVSLMGLTPPVGQKDDIWVQVSKAQESAQLLGKTLYHQGDLSYFEAVNKETLKNSYQRFEEEGIIQVVKSKDTRIPPRLRVAPEWRPGRDEKTGQLLASGRLWDFTEKIASSRREGKNRRDGATVSTRVVGLTDALGRKLFEEAISGEEGKGKGKAAAPARLSREDERSLSRSVMEQKRRRRLEGRAHL